jgi:hypothetical protein
VRAQSIRGRIALDGLYFRSDAPWRMALEAEMMSFPAGKHDDQVDALGLLGQLLDRMTAGPAEKPPAPPKDSWARATFERATATTMLMTGKPPNPLGNRPTGSGRAAPRG